MARDSSSSQTQNTDQEPHGLRYSRHIVGKGEFRVRETYVADHLVPLMRSKAVGAAKLDLVLRGIALLETHAGRRPVGTVLPSYSWEQLYALAGPPEPAAREDADGARDAEAVLRRQRKWVGEQLARLEARKLVQRVGRPGRRPRLLVLRDDGSGEPYDDPDGTQGNRYVRILGGLIASGTLRSWGAPELSAYLAAMVAERHHDAARGFSRKNAGTGRWFRPLRWFADVDGDYGSESRVLLPFTVPTLERGLHSLAEQRLIARTKTSINPLTKQRFQGPRIIYRNNFSSLDDPGVYVDDDDFLADLAKAEVDETEE